MYNNDYSSKEEVYMKSLPGNEEIASILYLEAPKLVEDHERGKTERPVKRDRRKFRRRIQSGDHADKT